MVAHACHKLSGASGVEVGWEESVLVVRKDCTFICVRQIELSYMLHYVQYTSRV